MRCPSSDNVVRLSLNLDAMREFGRSVICVDGMLAPLNYHDRLFGPSSRTKTVPCMHFLSFRHTKVLIFQSHFSLFGHDRSYREKRTILTSLGSCFAHGTTITRSFYFVYTGALIIIKFVHDSDWHQKGVPDGNTIGF
jgi:hypothetical protein